MRTRNKLSKMDLHNYYLHLPTLDISTLIIVNDKSEDNIFLILHRLIRFYSHKMTREKLDKNKLELCRMLLSYEYQLVFDDIEKHNDKRYISDTETICFPSIEAIFPAQYSRNTAETLILYDIIILQMVLYCNIKSIKQHLQIFLNSCNVHTMTSDARITYMKILECFLKSSCLYRFLYNDENGNKEEFKELGSMFLENIKSWIKIKEDSEWKLFTSIFPMLMDTFTPEYVLFPLWDYALSEINDLKESLIILSIMGDVCFTSSHTMESTYIYHDIFSKNTFWLLILEGLRSSLQQYRKQALYIMKKATEFTSTVHSLNLGLMKDPITPFICNKFGDSSIDDIRQKFFLVYEALEQKQYHLVVPALTHVSSLIKANEEHRSCNECFNVLWLQCILEKILQHENNNIVKWGISYICKLDYIIFNDQFLELFVNALNNTFLYECQTNEICPEIVKELATFFRHMEEKRTDILNRFLKKVSQITWGPVAIFYIIHILRTISQEKIQHSNWQNTELNAIKSLVEINLNMHSRVLRTASQIELLRTIPNFVQRIVDLTLLANILATFASGEGFTREAYSWNIITAWLQKVLTKEDAVAFVRNNCAKYLYENTNSNINPRTFALMIFLLHDSNLILSCKTCPTEEALNNWLCSLSGIDMRPYADIHLSIDIAEFMSHLLSFSTTESNSVTRLVSLHIHNTLKFVIKNARRMAAKLTYEDYTRYVIIVSSHINNANLFMLKRNVDNYAEKLQNESIYLLKDVQQHQSVQYLYGLHLLYLTQNILILPLARTFYTEHLLNMQITPVHNNNDIDAPTLKGKIASEYYLLLSKLTHQYLINSPTHSWIPTAMLLSNLLKFLELGSIEIVSEVATILNLMIDSKAIRDVNDRETFEYIFKLCWRCIFVSKKNSIFWGAIQNLIGIIMNNNLLVFPNAMEFTMEFINHLIEEGDNTPKFKRILLSKMKELDVRNLVKLDKPLLNCLLHGSVPRRDKRIENDAHLFIIKHLGQYYPKYISTMYHNDSTIRALATILLHRIISYPELNYGTVIVPYILEMLEKYKNKRYFNDSYLHKLKHRLLQILLLLEPVLNEELVILVQEKLCDLILLESNQHSVRLMQEWLLIRIFKRNINLHDQLWKFFAESIEKRPGCTISAVSIVYHVAQLSDNQKSFIQIALPYIAQCCLGQQFNMRLYNQFILVKLYEVMKEANDDDNILAYKGIYQAVVANLQRISTRNSIRIQNDFYFSRFHPINDYSLQTIYFELPRLTNVNCDEWISPNVFEAFTFEQSNNHPLQLYNIDSFLSESKTSMYLAKSLTDDTRSLVNNIETYLEGLQDIQKKIDPSNSVPPLYTDIFEAMKESIHRQNLELHEEGLIVVASFVCRPPNLGGIARTCEIFGVKTLVIASLDYVKDKEFQCLSVSAEKWINMLQVKPQELQEYLLEKKNTGWSLIGVEQTANSINLLETKFEKKTILVLGNEKEGIPANFIPFFDVCVEIPQVGVIRSLNVHVTAAICIWQYASQYILK